jgi:hypothetical protein
MADVEMEVDVGLIALVAGLDSMVVDAELVAFMDGPDSDGVGIDIKFVVLNIIRDSDCLGVDEAGASGDVKMEVNVGLIALVAGLDSMVVDAELIALVAGLDSMVVDAELVAFMDGPDSDGVGIDAKVVLPIIVPDCLGIDVELDAPIMVPDCVPSSTSNPRPTVVPDSLVVGLVIDEVVSVSEIGGVREPKSEDATALTESCNAKLAAPQSCES